MTVPILDSLHAASKTEILKVLMMLKPNTCSLDILPTPFMKLTAPSHVNIPTGLVNQSFASGTFPSELKKATITPLLKMTSLNRDILRNYRLVPSLPLTAKLLEKVAASRLSGHLREHGLEKELQSAYKPQQSCETALLKMQQDIATAMDRGRTVLLVMLDLSAAFDTVDGHLLTNTLTARFGVTRTAFRWFESYLSGRTHHVRIGTATSSERHLRRGVPQGSALGPLLFSLYTAPLSDILRKHGVGYHHYADDQQLYASYEPSIPGNLEQALARLQNCIRDNKAWMVAAKLRLSNDKTEFLAPMSPHQHRIHAGLSLQLGDVTVRPVSSVRNLGVYFDQFLTMHRHVSSVCSKASFHLRGIGSIRHYITREVCHSLVIALVISHLDFCNALLSGLSACQVQRLRKIQNRVARLVTLTPPKLPATPARSELHWLPVGARVSLKVLVYAFKAINDLAPEHLSDLLMPYTRHPRLRQLHDELQLATPVAATRVV